MKRVFNHSVARLAVLALLAVAVLSGCGGGAATTENPDHDAARRRARPTRVRRPRRRTSRRSASTSGKTSAATNRCGSCHNAGGQSPQFARSDDVNPAYQQAGGVVNRDNPSQSIIVAKVGGGHNCWLADAGACASIMTRWIQDWVGAVRHRRSPDRAGRAAGRRIRARASSLPAIRRPGADFIEAARARTCSDLYCSNCHQLDSATKQSPFFAGGRRPT